MTDHSMAEATGLIACSECGHLHFEPALGGGGRYLPCPLEGEGCDCPMAEELPATAADVEARLRELLS